MCFIFSCVMGLRSFVIAVYSKYSQVCCINFLFFFLPFLRKVLLFSALWKIFCFFFSPFPLSLTALHCLPFSCYWQALMHEFCVCVWDHFCPFFLLVWFGLLMHEACLSAIPSRRPFFPQGLDNFKDKEMFCWSLYIKRISSNRLYFTESKLIDKLLLY